ncbi:DUF3619 family protein [Ramlibacter sp.]|uniref:DUF3619 family protein n=1 Tax=Ramlibacter sp. TaxID=1917967 RepID=UPI002FC79AB9
MNDVTALAQPRQDQFGRRVAARLDAAAAELPRDISERLRAAREQAVSRRKTPAMQPARPATPAGNSQAALRGPDRFSPWQRIALALPIVTLVAGLVTIHVVQDERRATEVAEVDADLLTDDLPPAAYADPGFVQFLKTSR